MHMGIDSEATGLRTIAVSPDRKRVFVTRMGRDIADIAVIDTTTDEVTTIEIPIGAGAIDAVQVSPNGRRVYVATSDAYVGNLLVVDAEAGRIVDRVIIGSPIRDIAIGPGSGAAYVLACNPRRGGAVDTVDLTTNRVIGTLGFGGFPSQMALSAAGTRAFIVDRTHVVVMCTMTNQIVESIAVGAQPSCVATSPDGGRLYVADYTGVVSVFSVAAAATVPNFQATAMQVIAAPRARELEPVTV